MIARSISIANIAKTTIVLTAALAFLCGALGLGDIASVFAGGAFSVVNLYLIRLLVSRLMSPDVAGPPLRSVVTIKLLILLSVVAIVLKRLPIDTVSFLIGAGALTLAILLEAVLLGEPVAAAEDGPEIG